MSDPRQKVHNVSRFCGFIEFGVGCCEEGIFTYSTTGIDTVYCREHWGVLQGHKLTGKGNQVLPAQSDHVRRIREKWEWVSGPNGTDGRWKAKQKALIDKETGEVING